MSIMVEGREWKEYSIEWYDVEGRKFSFNISAISKEHASYILEEIKNTARLGDEVVGKYRA